MKLCIDPGHGGMDRGAAFAGLDEKDVVLDIALRLDKMLSETSVSRLLTRRTDLFVPLQERCAGANAWGATHFLSIHANADLDADEIGMPEAKGAEVWWNDPDDCAWAAYLGNGLRKEFPDEPWRGLRQARLKVLVSTKMPGALVEVAFIDDSLSNRKLRESAVRQRIAFALLRGVLAADT